MESNNVKTDTIFYENLDIKMEKYYRAFVFFRCPVTDNIKEFIKKAKYNNKAVFYDIDDLVFDEKYVSTIKYVREMSEEDKKVYYDGVNRMKETLSLCDYAITTTEGIANELKKYTKDVLINRNVASERMCELSLSAMKASIKEEDKIYIGYLSGSITHNPDFELIKPAIVKSMKKHDNLYLKVIGILDIPKEFDEFKDRIITEPFVSWEKLPEIIASLDINLSPLEDTLFNRAKSENKWMEAALVGVPTLASNVGAFKVIKDGVDGILVENTTNDWFEKLEELISNGDLRKNIGMNAHERVMKEYISTYSGMKLTNYIKSKMPKSIGFVLPTTNISGGVNVIIKHCNILRNNGYDVLIINNDKPNENIINNDGEIPVISSITSNLLGRFDTMVASLWATRFTVKDYPQVYHKSYLVQNYETNFGKFG